MHRRNFLKVIGCGIAALGLPIKWTPQPQVPQEIWLDINNSVSAKHRKLKAIWSYESQEDLRAWHNLECENDLIKVLSDNLVKEIDKELHCVGCTT